MNFTQFPTQLSPRGGQAIDYTPIASNNIPTNGELHSQSANSYRQK